MFATIVGLLSFTSGLAAAAPGAPGPQHDVGAWLRWPGDTSWPLDSGDHWGDPPGDTMASTPCEAAAAGRVVLDELMVDPPGSDAGAEWVELLARSDTNVGGWRIEAANEPTHWSTVFELPDGTVLRAGERLVVAGTLAAIPGALVLAPGATLGNASSSSDAVRLVDCAGEVVDVVAYGAANAAGQVFADEHGDPIEQARLAPRPTTGDALARVPDGADHDDGHVDLARRAPTPGTSNTPDDTDVPGGDTDVALCAPAGAVVLNELLIDPAGADAQSEWVELESVASSPIALSGWRVERATSPSSWDVAFTVPTGTTLTGGARLVLGGSATSAVADVALLAGAELGNAGSSSDAVRLVACDGDVVDVVVYGAANGSDAVFADEHGDAVEDGRLAPRPVEALALARVPDGVDHDDGRADLLVRTPTPGASNDGGPGASACDGGLPGDVLLNEVMPDPTGGDALAEWVELLHGGGAALDVSGWRIERATEPGAWATAFELPGDTMLPVGERLVVAGDAASVPDGARVVETGAELGNATRGVDAVRLVDCTGAVVDVLAYGVAAAGADTFHDAHGAAIADDRLAPKPVPGASLARRPDGADADDGGDVVLASPPTPGAPNDLAACTTGAARIRIDEILPDAVGADLVAGTEFVEFVSAWDVAVDLGGWSVAALASPGATARWRLRLPEGTVIGPGAFLVVGGSAVQADIVDPDLDLGSGSGGDLVVLEDCDGARVDGVIYGGPNTDGLAEDDGSVPAAGAGDPSEGDCVVRIEDGVDHDASATDFVVTPRCTPGRGVDGEAPGAADAGVGCGTGTRRAVEAPVRGASCATTRGPGVLGLFAVILRRRRTRRWSSTPRPE